jgi:hypothetical protein
MASGCFSTYRLEMAELSRLDGWRAERAQELRDVDGRALEFTGDTRLRWQFKEGFQRDERFTSLSIQGDTLEGVKRRSNRPLRLDLSKLQKVEAVNYSPGKTAAWSLGFGVGLPLALFGGVLALIFGAASVGGGG